MNLIANCQNAVGFLPRREFSSCTSRVEPENTVPETVLRLMAVSVNNGMDPGELGPKPLLQGVRRTSFSRMVDADLEIPYLYDANCWQFLPYIWPIDVAVDASETANLAQCVHKPFPREVPGVNDHISARQLVKDLTRQAVDGVRVRIRDDTYPHKCSPVAREWAVPGF